MISVILPTYKEAANIQQALRRAAAALRKAGEEFELIVVDDGGDTTAELAEALQQELPVRVLRRAGRQGLATAVVDGWNLARGDLLGVMDADLQHPPEVLAALAAAFREPAVDLAIASRRVAGGEMGQMPWARRLGSVWAACVAASLLPVTLGGVRDPMSGMFFIRAKALAGVRLDPTGYKILLEVLAKARYREVREVPYAFDRRAAGSSKLGSRQALEYFQHLWRLARSTGQLKTWLRYLAAGFAGACINLGALVAAVEHGGWTLVWAAPAAVQLALLSTFFLHHYWTFSSNRAGRLHRATLRSRLLRYEKLCLPGAILNVAVTLVLAAGLIPLLPAAAAGVLAESLWNFFLRVPAIWRIWTPHTSAQLLPET